MRYFQSGTGEKNFYLHPFVDKIHPIAPSAKPSYTLNGVRPNDISFLFTKKKKKEEEEEEEKRNKGLFKKNVYNPRDRSTVYPLKNDATSGLTNFILGDLISCRQDALHGDIRVSSL